MIRARVCTAALFFLGVMVISSAAFSQNIPTNWEVRYLNPKDNLRALAIDPLDPKIVFIGSDLAVIGTADGGETWTAGESFRTSSFSVTGAVSDEVLEMLQMIEEADETAAAEEAEAAAGLEAYESEGLDEALAEIDDRLAEGEQELTDKVATADELEAELESAREAAREAERAVAAAQAAVGSWEPETISASDVDGLTWIDEETMDEDDYQRLEAWLDERGISAAADAKSRQDDLKEYLLEHDAELGKLQAELAEAESARDEANARVDDLEHQLAVGAAETADIEEELATAEEEAEVAAEEEAAAPETLEEEAVFAEEEREEETVDLQATGINYLVFDPAASEKVYLAAFDGVYRSVNSGVDWEKIYTGPNPPQSAVLCLAVDPSNPDVIFAGTLAGIARSSDGGETWDRPGGRIANLVISRIAVHPFDSRIVLAGTAGYGIFKSSDGGGEWTQVLARAGAGANRVLAVEFAPSQPEVIYAGTMSGIYKSLDGGESWDPATGMGISPTILVRDLVVSPINPDLVVVAADQGVFGTVNGGGLWRNLAFGTGFNGSKFLAFDPLNPATVWLITSSRVFKSAAPGFLDLTGGEEMAISGCCEFTIDGRARHTLTIEEINEETGEVTVTIQSEPRTFTIKVGEAAAVDLTGDGEDDLNLNLESLEGGAPVFKLARIATADAAVAGDREDLLPPDQVTCLEDLEPYFRAEPTWVEVQQAAGRWAEVHPEKIAAWRTGASFRALLPRVSLDYREWLRRREDFDQREQYSYSQDYYSRDREEHQSNFDEGQQFQTAYTQGLYEFYRRDLENERERDRWYEEDRDTEKTSMRLQDTETFLTTLQKQGKITLRWDLGDFLYNKDQRYISVEVRHLVELRQDVVEQVTLYYFDRRTARIDMILNPPADPFSRVEMLLQIQQLDASLDAMTGGYFTQTIKEREKRCRR